MSVLSVPAGRRAVDAVGITRMKSSQKRRRGGTFGPELRAGDCIPDSGIHRGRGGGGGRPDHRRLACGAATGAANHRWVSVRDTGLVGCRVGHQLRPMGPDRHDSSSDRDHAAEMGLLCAGTEFGGVQPARGIPLPVLPIQCEHVRCNCNSVRRTAGGWMPLVRWGRLGGLGICDCRSCTPCCVAGCASKVLLKGLASLGTGRDPKKRSLP